MVNKKPDKRDAVTKLSIDINKLIIYITMRIKQHPFAGYLKHQNTANLALQTDEKNQ